jgi:hypothetical protein
MSFWIGEKVILKKSGRAGVIAEVRKDGKIKVKVDEKFILTHASNISVQNEEEFTFPDWVFEQNQSSVPFVVKNTEDIIDLHIEILEPSMANQNAVNILRFQLGKCRVFLGQKIQQKRSIAYIICGKGEGVLREEVKNLAKNEFGARFIIEKNDGGMLEIWL